MQHTHQPTCDLLLTADVAVTQDQQRIIQDAAIAITGGRIQAVGTRAELLGTLAGPGPGYLAVDHLHLERALLMPGLVNAHTHASMTLLRGLADDLPLMEWLQDHIFPRERHLTAEVVELGALLGCAEMIRTGTTAFQDMYLIESAVAAAVDMSGLRARLGEALFAFPSPAYREISEGFALVREQAARYRNHSRIRIGVMPHTVFTTTPAIMAASRDLCLELGLPLHMHLSETPSEVESCLEAHGKRPVAYCNDLGLFDLPVSAAHGVVLDEHELDLLKAHGVTVVHNPRSNMKLASGVAPVPGMLRRGMLPALGTDGASSNNALNMFAEMSACALLHKVHGMDATECPAQTVLDMATLGGAAALAWPEIGRLAPGCPADIIALDLDSPNLLPMYSPVSHLVYAASGHEVRMSMVDGRVLYRDGEYLSLDYPSLLMEAEKMRRWILARA